MATVVDRIRQSGIAITLDGERLVVEADAPLTDEQRAYLRKYKSELVAELRRERGGRAIVEYRFDGDPTWFVMLGRPGESFEEAAAGCSRQFLNVVETRERDSLPAGFPFRRPADNDGEWKDVDGNEL